MKARKIRNIAKKYGIALIYLFGSQAENGARYLAGDNISVEDLSDLDVAVAFENIPSEAIKIYGALYKEFSKIFAPFVESYLRRSLEAVFDIGRHILSKTSGFKEIEYKTIAKELGSNGVVTKELSDVLITMAGYRNRMVHFCREVTPQDLYQIAKDNIKDIERFTKEIALFIKNYQKKKK